MDHDLLLRKSALMMKKAFLLLILSGLYLSKLTAIEILPLTAKAAYFYPTSSRFRDIYSDAGRYSLETNIQAWKDLYAFGEIGFLYTTGSSVGLGNHTRLYSIPINLGLKYFFHFDRLHPYLGLGLTVAYSNIQNDSADVTRSPSGWGVGGIGKVGFLAYLTNSVFFDFFADYTYLKTSLSRDKTKRVETRKANLSGLAIGAGIGFRF